MNCIYNQAIKSSHIVSYQNGILQSVRKAERFNGDPYSCDYGVVACDTTRLGGAKYGGRSSGGGFEIYDAFISTIGETIERYCPSIFRIKDMRQCSYKEIRNCAIHPSEYALFSKEQYSFFNRKNYNIQSFDEDSNIYWDKCIDLTSGKEVYCPCSHIYLPWNSDRRPIIYGVSTGLAAHSNFNKSVLTSLYEVLERDSFVLTWFQEIVPPKFFITDSVKKYLSLHFPTDYEWHFFDITYDLEIPTVFGICVGKAEFGDFIAVGTATRFTKGEALKKVIQEIAQTIPYYRFMLSNDHSIPSDDFSELKDFEQHSMFYMKRKEYRHVFDRWLHVSPSVYVDINEKSPLNTRQILKQILSKLKEKGYNVLLKDLTTVDAFESGFFCTRVIVPQLLQMTGAYTFYPLGGKRLYEVPKLLGYISHEYDKLNKYPHPFP